jgi:hypothetical protein
LRLYERRINRLGAAKAGKSSCHVLCSLANRRAAEEASRAKNKQESQEVNLRAVNAIKRSHSQVDGDGEGVEIVATIEKQCAAPKIIDLD